MPKRDECMASRKAVTLCLELALCGMEGHIIGRKKTADGPRYLSDIPGRKANRGRITPSSGASRIAGCSASMVLLNSSQNLRNLDYLRPLDPQRNMTRNPRSIRENINV